jgi:hypothetical protein
MATKFYPEVGTKLYLSQRTGNYYVDMVKTPYTVIGVSSGKVLVQECQLIFNGPRYYDTLADEIKANPNGQILELNWAPKKARWQIDKYKSGYPSIATFGRWDYQPYLD